jgi:hypothetical protein
VVTAIAVAPGRIQCTPLFVRARQRRAWSRNWFNDVEGFMAYYVVYAPDDNVTAIRIFNNHAGAEERNRRGLVWIEQEFAPLMIGPATAVAGPVIVLA